MRGKGRARIVLFATRGATPCAGAAFTSVLASLLASLPATLLVWAMCAGLFACAAAGNPATFGNVPDAAADAPTTGIPSTATEAGIGDALAPSSDTSEMEPYDASEMEPYDASEIEPYDASEIEPYDAVSSVPEASTGADASQDATVAENGDAATADATAVDAVTEEQGDDGGSDAGTVTGGDATVEAGSAMDATATVDAVAVVDAATDAASPPPSGDGASEAAACGGCGIGFTCGSGGYCVSSTGVPAFGHVYVIVMEEQSLSAIQGSSSAPYINTLIASYALATNYTTPYHPSLPNYLELTSGGTQGVACDCAPGGTPTCSLGSSVCDPLLSNCNCPQSVTNLGDELDTAGLSWREYAEGMGAPCDLTGADGGADFAPSHVPFLYYDDVYTASGRCVEHVRDYGDFPADLAAGSYVFAMISPNTCHDMQTL